MFSRILRHEWLTLRADATVWVVAVAARAGVGLAGLVLPAAVLGWLGLARMRRYPVVG